MKKGQKKEIFTGKMSFLEIHGGVKISYFGQIFTPAPMNMVKPSTGYRMKEGEEVLDSSETFINLLKF